ncbi:hypothetical protein S83_060133, partial [Arachis hypogaea]
FRSNDGQFEMHKQTTSSLLDVIERHAYDDVDLNSKLTSEMRIFKNKSYGCGTLNLQNLAIRVLSQTCSSSDCEQL